MSAATLPATTYHCGGCKCQKDATEFYPSNSHYCKTCCRRSEATANAFEQETREILTTVPWATAAILAEREALEGLGAQGASDAGWWRERYAKLLDAELLDQIRRLGLSTRDYLILSDPRIEYPWPKLGGAA